MALKLDLKKSIRRFTFAARVLDVFGTKRKSGDEFVFDRRGAVRITNKTVVNKYGEIITIRGVQDAGSGVAKSFTPSDSMILSRPQEANGIAPSAAMDSYNNWSYAAIKPIADEIAGIEWRFFKVDAKGKHKEVQDHELIDFLEAVNDFQTGPEFRHTLAAHLELTGNAYVYLVGVKNDTDKPTAMHLLNPGGVEIKIDKTTFPFKIDHYEYKLDGRIFRFMPYEILQIKYPNPNDPFSGIGSVQAAAEWIDNDNKLTEFQRQFFKNGAQIGLTFETDMTSEEQLQELKESFNEQHSGVHNSYKAMFLPKGVKNPTNDVKFTDIGFNNLSDNNRDKILAAFRVPKTVIGFAEQTTNRSTAETADYVFARRTIKPKMILICSFLNEFLAPRFAKDIFISFDDPVTEDKMATSNLMKNSTGGLPVTTINEAREEYLDMDPIEGGDDLMMPNNYAPANALDMDVETEKPQPTEKPAPEGDEEPQKSKRAKRLGYVPIRTGKAKTRFAKNVEIRHTMAKDLAGKIYEIVKAIKSKKLNDMTDDDYEAVILKEKDDRIHNFSKEIVGALRNLNQKQKEEVMRNLPRATKRAKALDVSKLFNLDKWVNFTVSALKGIATDMFAQEALEALTLIDVPGFDVVHTPEAADALDHALTLLGESYNQTTLDLLKSKLTEGLAAGEGAQQLGARIDDIYAWKDTYAAERVALTETRRIVSMSNTIAWKQSGVVKELRWITSHQGNVCEFCDAMNDTVVSIEENFLDKGDEFEGTDGSVMTADYSAVGGPPLHPNCHCGVRPVVTTEIEASALAPKQKDEDEELIAKELNELEKHEK